MTYVDCVCELCGAVFQKRINVPGRPQIYCGKGCRKKAVRLRAGLRFVDLEKCEPWTGEGYEPWTLDDDGPPGSP